MTEEKISNGLPPHFIVIVPGYMGSKLRDKNTGEIVWLDLPGMLRNPFKIGDAVDTMLKKMTYPNADLEPAGILDDVLIAPPWVKQEHYGRLIERLKEWKYKIDPAEVQPGELAAYTFSYDWRQDNRISARQLGKAIEGWQKRHPGAKAWLIAHSNGGIISRWYVQQEGGRDRVGKLLFMGSPWDGAPKSIRVLMEGMEVLGLKKFNLWNLGSRMKSLIRSFPSFYQLVPLANPFLRDEENEVVNLYDDPSWLDNPRDRAYLEDARKFNETLAQAPGIEDTICFYGTRSPTTTAGLVTRNESGGIQSIQWLDTGAGDGTVPTRSAVHPWVDEKHKVRSPATHGNIYIEDSVLEYLRYEFVARYMEATKGAISVLDYNIVFEPDKDFYEPGEAIQVWAQIESDEGPVSEADVKARLIFREPLPGSTVEAPPPPSEWVRLRANKQVPGRYEASLPAQTSEGYYRILAKFKVPQKLGAEIEELVVVESMQVPEAPA
jgi:pimeloyl-ACP methyl ester carboxylesterase